MKIKIEHQHKFIALLLYDFEIREKKFLFKI